MATLAVTRRFDLNGEQWARLVPLSLLIAAMQSAATYRPAPLATAAGLAALAGGSAFAKLPRSLGRPRSSTPHLTT